MALLDSGNVPLAPSGSTTQNMLPEWYTNYAQDILSRQTAMANTPFATYQPPRIAGFTPDQQSGFDATRASAMGFQPALTQATEATQGVLGRSAFGAASPTIQQGAGLVSQSAQGGGALSAAQPYLNAASGTSVQNIGTYMNPYTQQVVDRIGDVGARTLREKLLPEISDRFIGAGQFGGTRQSEIIGRALRDTMEGISAEQARALESGYGQALNTAGTDMSRAAGLASTAGSLAGADRSAMQSAGSTLADIGSRLGSLYDTDTGRSLAGAEQLGMLAKAQQELGLSGAGALQNIGQQQQNLDQKNLDLAYQDFIAQRDYPQSQINGLIGALQGVKSAIPTSVINESYAPYSDNNATPQTSGLQNAATAAGLALQIKQLFG